jgi:hypothetical protein
MLRSWKPLNLPDRGSHKDTKAAQLSRSAEEFISCIASY